MNTFEKLESPLEKLARVFSREYGLSVTFGGSGACISLEQKKMMLPAITTPEMASLVHGYLDHESSHVRFTSKGFKFPKDKMVENIGRMLEDVRVDAAIGAEYLGAKENIYYVRKVVYQECMDKALVVTGSREAVFLMDILENLGGRLPLDKCGETATKAIDLAKDLFAKVPDLKSTEEAFALAQAIVDRWGSLIPESNIDQPKMGGEEGEEKSSKPKKDSGKEKKDKGKGKDEEKSKDKGASKPKDKKKDNEDEDEAGDAGEGDSKADSESGEGEGKDKDSKGHDGDRGEEDGDSKGGEEGDSDKGDSGDDESDFDERSDDGDEGDDGEESGSGEGSDDDGDPSDSKEAGEPGDFLVGIRAMIEGGGAIGDVEKAMTDSIDRLTEAQVKEALSGTAKTHVPFSTKYDEIKVVSRKRDSKEDELRANARRSVGVLMRRLELSLMARDNAREVYELDRGKIDSKRLHCLATATSNRVFKKTVQAEKKDTAVYLLVDCSGSMGGKKIQAAREAAAAFSECLDRLGIPNEVAGFQSRFNAILGREFLKATDEDESSRRIFNRWSEKLLHYIVKPFGKSFKDGSFAALDAGGNNVDGESVMLAAKLLAKRPEKKKVLIVFSDGAPCAEGQIKLLNQDLRNTVAKINAAGIHTIGVGIQTSHVEYFYPDYIVLENADSLPVATVRELERILLRGVSGKRATNAA